MCCFFLSRMKGMGEEYQVKVEAQNPLKSDCLTQETTNKYFWTSTSFQKVNKKFYQIHELLTEEFPGLK
jgi:hypothetical protein